MAGELQPMVYGEFAVDFEFDRLADLCEPGDGVQTGPFGSQLHQQDYVTVGTPIITVEHLGENRILHSDIPCVSESDTLRLSKYSLRKGDIVFSRVGSVDRRALVRDEEEGWLFSGRCLRVRPDKARVDPGYLSYFFGLPAFKEHIRAIAVGATMPSLNTQILGDVTIYYPPLPEQRAIAHILGTLDDKIELNRRMNETLEAMARAIFKAWFVDFEPVRAKMEGRDPGLPKHLADLFPDRLVDSELGEIPEGWRYASVGDEVQVVKGVSYRSEELADSDTALVTLKSINRGGGYRRDGLKPYRGEYKPEQVITAGELVVAQTDVTQAAEVIGRPALSLPDDRFQVLVASLDILIIRPTKGDLPREFFYLLFLTSEFQDHIYGHTNGTTVLHLAKTGVPSYVFVRPPAPVTHAFAEVIVPLFQRIAHNESLSRTLAALRDAVLPKLISGEIRIEYPERIVAGEMP